MKNNFIILLCGKSGAGKTVAAEAMEKKFGWKSVQSYTDRPKRTPNETGHICVSPEEFDMIPRDTMVAYSEFDGHRYGATFNQVEDSEIYVIDKKGIETFQDTYRALGGKKEIIVIEIYAPERLRKLRMEARGDKPDKIEQRLIHDEKAFDGIEKYVQLRYYASDLDTPEYVADQIKKLTFALLMQRSARHMLTA